MRTYKMTISYDGTRYQGWQRQAMTDNTIQHILEWTIGRMVGYRVQVDGSGRTDSGRACTWSGGQREAVEAVRCGRPKGCIEPFAPEDIRIIRVELVRNGFHARKSAKGKKYEYYIDAGKNLMYFPGSIVTIIRSSWILRQCVMRRIIWSERRILQALQITVRREIQ